ncbi:MAG: helix-turn-helix domain-containing protein [Chloroflexi bacterium]|nr:helix-turn-helix domain-containing protein [Chloroflexota bacterium]
MRKEKYLHLTNAEREEINRFLAKNKPLVEIAKHLGRSSSTISREIRRNSGKTGYRAFSASKRSQAAASSYRN